MRVQGWESLLAEHIKHAYATPFEWGAHDCALWTADWVRKATGVDLSDDLRGKYASEDEAAEVLSAMGYESVADLADAHLPQTPINFAKRGDIVLNPQGVLGICEGVFSHFPMAVGATRLLTERCVRAWKVG